MSIDYDAAQETTDPVSAIEELKSVSATRAAQQPDLEDDNAEVGDTFELPGADLSDESLTVRVDPKKADEFTCAGCFLVRQHTQLADADQLLCHDCAS